MCGITCIYNKKNSIDEKVLFKMTNSLKHRGPCASGIRITFNGKIGIGHTRLRLVDLSSNADQPIEVDNCILSFNGEIYNYKELREELRQSGSFFRTSSDAEVIIRAVQKWGISTALSKFNGCFAFIFYNKNNKKLYIARDPIGEKQIVYYKAKNGDWIFASETKAIINHPSVPKEPNLNRFVSDLVFKFFSDKKETYFKNIFYVPAGHYVLFNLDKNEQGPRFVKYWDINNHFADREELKNNIPDIINHLNELLIDSVRLRMDADCELGSILSGGLDSSIITKIAADYHSNKYKEPFKCFTIKCIGGTNRDLKNARLLHNTIKNINLYEIEISNKINLGDLDKITFALEEPLLDKVYFAQFMNYKISKRFGLNAVINGQGADELWLGYYFFYKLFNIPVNKINYDYLIRYWASQFKFYSLTKSKQIDNTIKNIIMDNLDKNFRPYENKDKLKSLLNFSIKTHLQSMFIQEDRLSMTNSVEVRLPHVDLRIVKLALSLPSKIKIFDGREKYILRKLRQRIVPKEIYTRKKLAFPNPPYKYDKKIEILFDKKEISRSAIISQIFKSDTSSDKFTNFYYKLPIRDRWILLAISRMEKVFFN